MKEFAMKKIAVIVFAVGLGGLAACGGKSAGSTTPATTSDPGQPPASDGTGGNTYGAPAAPSGDPTSTDPSAEGFTDPCAPTE